jgi:hypothetical protein
MVEERITLTVNLSIDAEFPHDVFTTALEGGIGYWSECHKYRWSKGGPDHEADLDGFYAIVEETESGDDTPPRHRVDREVILRGLSRLFAGEHKGLHPKTAALIMEAAITGQSGRLDASDADCLVQIGLFGEVVYG